MTSAEHFISLITVASAKKLATVLVVCFIIYHGVIHLIYGIVKILYFCFITHIDLFIYLFHILLAENFYFTNI